MKIILSLKKNVLPLYSKKWNLGFFWISLLSILGPLPFHHRHDYSSYTDQWKNILVGGNPWHYPNGEFSGNAYGPLFNGFAFLYGIYSHLPHLIFIFIWLGLSRFTLNQIAPTSTDREKKGWFLFLLLNPFFLTTIVSYGHFDIVVALFCVLSLLLIQKRKEVLAGVSLSIAILLKFYPILIFPFLAYQKKNDPSQKPAFNWKFILVVFILVSVGMISTYSFYGDSSLTPLLFGKDRVSTFLSFFRFIRSPYSPIRSLVWSLDFLSSPLMLLSALFVGGLYLLRPKDYFYSLIVALFLVFMFYKVAHPQFYTSLFFLVPLWIHEKKRSGNPIDKTLYRSLVLPLAYVSFSMLIYVLTQGFKHQWVWVDDFISLPFFLLQLVCYPILIKRLIE